MPVRDVYISVRFEPRPRLDCVHLTGAAADAWVREHGINIDAICPGDYDRAEVTFGLHSLGEQFDSARRFDSASMRSPDGVPVEP